jgi:hypothetical protein
MDDPRIGINPSTGPKLCIGVTRVPAPTCALAPICVLASTYALASTCAQAPISAIAEPRRSS